MDFGTFALEFVEMDLETAFEGETGIELDLEFEPMMTKALHKKLQEEHLIVGRGKQDAFDGVDAYPS
jgi:hypothetical protein